MRVPSWYYYISYTSIYLVWSYLPGRTNPSHFIGYSRTNDQFAREPANNRAIPCTLCSSLEHVVVHVSFLVPLILAFMSVFVYGTLQYPKILKALLGRVPVSEHAIVKGYVRYGVKGEPFPAVVQCHDGEVPGLVLSGLDQTEMDILDEYEGEQYAKRSVDALIDGKHVRETLIYVWKDEYNEWLDGKEWNREAFETIHFEDYFAMVNDTKKSTI